MRQYLIFALLVFLFFPSLVISQESSIAQYTKAIEESPDDMKYRFLNYRGKAYWEQGDINSAIMDFSQSISLNPTREAYTLRGKIYFEKKRYSPAIKDFSKALEISPTPELYELRGKSYLAQKLYTEAVEDGTRLIELDPNISESYNLRMEAYAQVGENELAYKDYSIAIQLNSQNHTAHKIREKYSIKEEIILKGTHGAIAGPNYDVIGKGTQFSSNKKRNMPDSKQVTPEKCKYLYNEYQEYLVEYQDWARENFPATNESMAEELKSRRDAYYFPCQYIKDMKKDLKERWNN